MRCVPKSTVGLLLVMIVVGCGRTTSVEPTRSDEQIDGASASQTSSTDANTVLASALAEAASTDKNVLVHLGAPW